MMKFVILMWISVILAACGGGGGNTAESATLAASQANAQPPALQVTDTLDRSSGIAGPDANRDGIRDDINKWIDAQAYSAPQQKAVAQLARTFQASLLIDTNDKTAARAAAEKDGEAIGCVYEAFKPDAEQPSRIVSQIEAITANTKERAMQYVKYNAALGGMAFRLPDKPTCD